MTATNKVLKPKKFFTWFLLLTKRQLKNIFFLILLLLLPIVSLAIKNVPKKESSVTYNVGLYISNTENNNKADAMALSFVNGLMSANESITFIQYFDEELLKKEIINEKLICGYVIPEALSDNIKTLNFKSAFSVYKLPATSLSAAVNDIFYAELIKWAGYQLIQNEYIKFPVLAEYSSLKDIFDTYNVYLKSDETVQINYHKIESDNSFSNIEDISDDNRVRFPLRGVLSIFVLIAGLFGSFLYMYDRENGVLQTVSHSFSKALSFLYAFIPGLLIGISACIAITISSENTGILRESGIMLLYVITTALLSMLFAFATRKSQTLGACIPVLIMLSLVFCPIFINLCQYFSAAKYMQRLFLPYYYMSFFF